MGDCLIVANQTLGGAELQAAIRERVERGVDSFYVLVPMTAPADETTAWFDGFSLPSGMTSTQASDAREVMEELARRRRSAAEEARERAEHRLGRMIEEIQASGGRAAGRVGDADPPVAVGELLRERSFDEIIVSTLPSRISRWLKLDVPSQVERLTDIPVTTVEARPSEGPQ